MPGTGARDLSMVHRLFQPDPPSTLVIAAHPDDEVIGAAAVLMRLRGNASVLHITDGAPRNLKDASRAGFATAAAYAEARKREAAEALSLIPGIVVLDGLGIPDQSACRSLTAITHQLIDVLRTTRPDIVLTHGFEGGHPDHDAVAFAAAHATRACGVRHLEMAGYFEGGDGIATHRFAQSDWPAFTYTLTPDESRLKRRMLDCFRTQAQTLEMFGTRVECYRPAPVYDFTKPPNGGRALYDRYDWGLRSSDWPRLVAEAQRQLEALSPQ